MNKNFSEWYIENKITLSEEKQLEKRWQGVEGYCKEATSADITNLTLLFFGFDVDDEFIEKLCSVFKNYDDFFSKKALPEIRVLSGAILLQLTQTNQDYSSYIELLAKSASFAQGRAINSSILNEIELKLKQDSDAIRKSLNTKAELVAVPKTKKMLEFLESRTWDENTFAALGSFITETAKAFTKTNQVIKEMSDVHKIRVEESQLLWWLTAGWNGIKNCSYKSMSKEEACLFIGYEMAELVQVFPGPYPADGIIFRMIELCKGSKSNVTFADIVQAIPSDFSEVFLNQHAQQDNLKLLPLSMAIKYAHNTSSPVEWSNKYTIESNNVDIVNKKLPPAEFAKQLFFEILAQRCLDAIDE